MKHVFPLGQRLAVLLLVGVLLLPSCASILNPAYQKVSIPARRKEVILVNGEEPKKKDGAILLKRDMQPKQITLQRDGYLDENVVIMQDHKSLLYWLSWVGFGWTLWIPLLDNGPKTYDYPKERIRFGKTKLIDDRAEVQKELLVNKVSIDLKKEDLKIRTFYSYGDFMANRKDRDAKSVDDIEDVAVENTVFANSLNQILKEKGFIDTTRNALKDSYLDNILVNASIQSYTWNRVNMAGGRGSMLFLELKVEWEILDLYEQVIFTTTTEATSGQFAQAPAYDLGITDAIEAAVKDAMDRNFHEFMDEGKVKYHLKDRSIVEKEKAFVPIGVSASRKYTKGVGKAVASTVTISSDNGFGSGFIISEDGFVVSNYHVIADTGDYKIRFADGVEKPFEVVRVSKIYDLALLKVDTTGLNPLKVSRDTTIELASDIYAIGTSSAEDLGQTITRGIVSAMRRKMDSELIQTDASVNGGNSGGPLVNKDGEVVGVVTSKLFGFSVDGVAFGIPAYEIYNRLNIDVN